MKTLFSWNDLFATAGFSYADLDEVTAFLAAHPEALGAEKTRFAGKMVAHLDAIQRRVRDRKAVQHVREDEERREEESTCTLCGNSGMVEVPHPKGVVNGEWVQQRVGRNPSQYTIGVTCPCPAGQWRYKQQANYLAGKHKDAGKDGPPPLPWSLDAYQQRNPKWREQMRQRLAEQLAASALEPVKDKQFAAAVDRLVSQAKENA